MQVAVQLPPGHQRLAARLELPGERATPFRLIDRRMRRRSGGGRPVRGRDDGEHFAKGNGNKAAGTRARKGLRTLKNTASELVRLTLGKE